MIRALLILAIAVFALPLIGLFDPTHPARAASASRPAPAALSARVDQLGRAFGGTVGISVRDIDEGWAADFGANRLAPQQSVSKLWVALTVFDAFDRGDLRPEDAVTITRDDLTLFHQPIRAQVGEAGYRTTISDLLERAMTQSDNTANDALLRRVGGPEAIRTTLNRMRIDHVRFGPGERLLQSKIAGIAWRQAFSTGNAFQTARATLPIDKRVKAIEAYVDDPIDGAAPAAITLALSRLVRGELLTPRGTQNILALMERSKTGRQRLRSALSPEWSLAHKTGTGQEVGGIATGFNDVGLLTAPDGHRYAVAVMIAKSTRPIAARQQLIADVGRAVIEHWSATATSEYGSPRR